MSKISIKCFDVALQPKVRSLRLLSFLLSRPWGVVLVQKIFRWFKGKEIKGLVCEERFIPSRNNGPDIRIRIFRPKTKEALPAMLYIHGGGYLVGLPELSLYTIKKYIETRPCIIIAPDYRKGLKHGYPDGFNDCYDTLLWMKENYTSLGMLSDRFVVSGHSAGGGLAAAVTLKACDTRAVNIAFQMPIYPMLDYRQKTSSAKEMGDGVPVWNSKSNALGWKTYLQHCNGTVPPYASVALADDLSHLPPTITFVGELEPFKDETIEYVEALKKANIPVKFALFPKAFHAFEQLVKHADVAKKANAFHLEAWGAFYDLYLINRSDSSG